MEEIPASALFNDFHHETPDELSESTFDTLYEEVTKVDTEDLEDIYREWNHGSGQESSAFRELRYCEQCLTYIEGSDEVITHASQNHDYDPFMQAGEPEYIRGERSMSVGDIVEQDDTYYACAQVGWEEIKLVEGDTESV